MFYKRILSSLLLIAAFDCSSVTAQDKVIIGVGEITSSIREANPENFQTMLETVLVKTNKFEVIERSRMEEILKERGMSIAGITEGQDSIGGIEGVDYLVYGSITKLGESEKQSNFLIAGLNKREKNYEAGVDLRIVDVSNGRIALADNVEVSTQSKGSYTLGGLEGYGAIGTSGGEGDPLGDIQRLAAAEVAGVITTTISPIKVAAVQSDGTVILNYGDSILGQDDVLTVFQLGKGFADPDTGEILGAEEIEICTLKIEDALPKFSKSTVVSGNPPAVGDLVRKMSSENAEEYLDNLRKSKKKKRRRS